MAVKNKREENIEEFKNLSNDENIVYAAELNKERQQKRNQKKAKIEKEKHSSKEDTITTDVNKTNNDELKSEIIDNCEPMQTPVVETIEEVIQTINTTTEPIEEKIETIEEKVETIEEKIETIEETPQKQVYDIKRMFGYDWMGVVYDE